MEKEITQNKELVTEEIKASSESSISQQENSDEAKKSDYFSEEKEQKPDLKKKRGKFFSRNSERKRNFQSHLQNEILETKRVVKVTKGGRRFSFARLVLVKDQEKKTIAFAYAGGKEAITAFRKSSRQAQRKLLSYFGSFPPRTIPQDIIVHYKATKILLKPTPPGSGIKAGGILSKLFKFLEIKDISAKIIGSRNKLNVIQAAFRALDKLTHKKYDY